METNSYGLGDDQNTRIPISPNIDPIKQVPQGDLSTSTQGDAVGTEQAPPTQKSPTYEIPQTPRLSDEMPILATESEPSYEIETGPTEKYQEEPTTEKPAPVTNNLDDMVNFADQKQASTDQAIESKRPRLDFSKIIGNKKLLIGAGIAIAVVVVAALGIVLYPIVNPNKIAVVSANQSPIDITIDGIETKNIQIPAEIKIRKGKHTIIAAKEGFSSITKEIEIAGGQKEITISFDMIELLRAERIIETKVSFPAYNTQLSTIVYFEEVSEGEYSLKEFNPANKVSSELADGFKNIEKVAWSPTFRQLVIRNINKPENEGSLLKYIPEYGEGTRINWLVDLERSDLVNVKVQPLHPSIKTVGFKPEGDKIVYYFQNENTKTVATAAPNGTGFENILSIVSLKFEPDVSWSQNGKRVVIFADKEDERIQKVDTLDISTYNFETKNAYKITEDAVSYEAILSPSGNKIIYQSSNDIYVADLEKKEQGGEDAEKSNINLEIRGDVSNCSWVDENNLIFFNKDTKDLAKVRIDGEKETIGYNKEGIPGSVAKIIYKNRELFLFTDNGAYGMKLGTGV